MQLQCSLAEISLCAR